jgi:hypothetical protein
MRPFSIILAGLAVGAALAPASAVALSRCPGDPTPTVGPFPFPEVVGYAVTTGAMPLPPAPTALPATPPEVRLVGGVEHDGMLVLTVRFAEAIRAGCDISPRLLDSAVSLAQMAQGRAAQINELNIEGSRRNGGTADGTDLVRIYFQTGHVSRSQRLDRLVFQFAEGPKYRFVVQADPLPLGPVMLSAPTVGFGGRVTLRAETPATIAAELGDANPAVDFSVAEQASGMLNELRQPFTAFRAGFDTGFRPARAVLELRGGFVRQATTVNLVAAIGTQRAVVPLTISPWSCQPDIDFKAESGGVVVVMMGNSGTGGCPAMTAAMAGASSAAQTTVAIAAGVPPPPAAASPVVKPVVTNRLRTAPIAAIAAPPAAPGWMGRFTLPPSALMGGVLQLTLQAPHGPLLISWRPSLTEINLLRSALPK